MSKNKGPSFEPVDDNTEILQPDSSGSIPTPKPVPQGDPAAPGKPSLFKKSSRAEEAPRFQSEKQPASTMQPAYNKDPYSGQDEGGNPALWLGGAALLLALAALLVSLGVINPMGENQITSSEIAPGAVGQPQIFSGAVTRDKIDPELIPSLRGPTGPAGKRGTRGEEGARGAKGPAGLSALSLITGESINGTSAAEASTVAVCPDNRLAISGGGDITGGTGSVALTVSQPTRGFVGWRVAAVQTKKTNASWSLRAYAVCAEPSSALRKNTSG